MDNALPTQNRLGLSVLTLLLDGEEKSGRELLALHAETSSSPKRQTFYEMMQRMERQGLITAAQKTITIHGYRVRIPTYRISRGGEELCTMLACGQDAHGTSRASLQPTETGS